MKGVFITPQQHIMTTNSISFYMNYKTLHQKSFSLFGRQNMLFKIHLENFQKLLKCFFKNERKTLYVLIISESHRMNS